MSFLLIKAMNFQFRTRSRRDKRLAAGALLALLLGSPFGGAIEPSRAAGRTERPALLFDIDQGFPSGITENLDLVALNRIFDVIEKFRTRFDVYAIVSPLTAKTENLHAVLRQAAAHHVKFLLDVYTSDAMTIGNIILPANSQADPTHDLTISLDGLRKIKADKEIGPYFSGLRFFEVLAGDFTVKTCIQRARGSDRVDWCDHFSRNVVTMDVFRREIAKPLLDFGKQYGMWVFWADWKWDAQTAEQQKTLRKILAPGGYSDIIVLAYANNLPGEAARDDDSNWRQWSASYAPLVGSQIRGLGISDQSWTCDFQHACPVDVIKNWALRALRSGAVAVELEPANYFFELPVGGASPVYLNSPEWRAKVGRPSAQLVLLADALGVDLRTSEPKPLSRGSSNDATCVSMTATKQKVKAGERVVSSVTFQNAGSGVWASRNDFLAVGGSENWGITVAQLPTAAVAPGQSATFTLNLTVPVALGARRLDLSMKQNNGAAFGQPCSLLFSVANSPN